MGHTGLFSTFILVQEHVLTFSADDFEDDVAQFDNGEFNAKLGDIMEKIDAIIRPEPSNDHSDSRDTSAWDQRTFPILSPTVGPGEGPQDFAPQPRASLPSLPRITTSPLPKSPSPSPIPQSPSKSQRTKKQSTVGKVWERLKRWFTRKFEGEDPPPKLSDKLVPERDDKVKWYESLFSELPEPFKPKK